MSNLPLGLPPWVENAYDLIEHADCHLHDGTDRGRRIALVGFDNSVEVSINIFVQIGDKLRGGHLEAKEIARAKTKIFDLKIEFLEMYLERTKLPFAGSTIEIQYCHRIRNYVYHSNHRRITTAAADVRMTRKGAIAVFDLLFGTKLPAVICPSITATSALVAPDPIDANDYPPHMQTDAMVEWLRQMIEFSSVLITLVDPGNRLVHDTISSLKEDWTRFNKLVGEVPPKWREDVSEAMTIWERSFGPESVEIADEELFQSAQCLAFVASGLPTQLPSPKVDLSHISTEEPK